MFFNLTNLIHFVAGLLFTPAIRRLSIRRMGSIMSLSVVAALAWETVELYFGRSGGPWDTLMDIWAFALGSVIMGVYLERRKPR